MKRKIIPTVATAAPADCQSLSNLLYVLKDDYREYLCDALQHYILHQKKDDFGSLVLERIFSQALSMISPHSIGSKRALELIQAARNYQPVSQN